MGDCLLAVGIVIIVFWLLGFIVLCLGTLIHTVLDIGVIFMILWLLRSVFKLLSDHSGLDDSDPSGTSSNLRLSPDSS